MKTSLKGKMSIMVDEGIVLSRYKDAVGVWTIGVGHTKNAGNPDPQKISYKLSFAQVMEIFTNDLAKFEKRVNDAIKVPVTQSQFDALVSFDFNTGGIKRASLTKKLNAKDYSGAAKGLLAWNKGGGKVLKALTHRRKKEKAIFENGAYGDFIASIYPATPAGKVQWSKAQRVNLQTLLTQINPPDSVTEIPDELPGIKPKPSIWGIIAALIANLFKGAK